MTKSESSGVARKMQKETLDHFHGYCFLKDGTHTPPVNLYGTVAAIRYVRLQMGLQYRVIVVDESDSIVIEAIQGKLVFPVLQTKNH
jgi:hypothetical protein